MLTMWRYVQTAAWPQPEPQPDRSSLYINNGDVTQTAAVRTAAVCLGHNMKMSCSWSFYMFVLIFCWHLLLSCCKDEATEISYSAPSVIVKQRKRGVTDAAREDGEIVRAIKQGKHQDQLDILRSDRQKKLFNEFKQG